MTDAMSEGAVKFVIEVPVTDEYFVWARTLAIDLTHDSFYISANDGSPETFDMGGSISPEWQWRRVHGEGSPHRRFLLEKGENTIIFGGREPDTGLDRVIITNDLGFTPPADPH